MSDFANPTHVGYVQQAIDTFFDFDESTIIGKVANSAWNNGAWRISLCNFVPRIVLNLLHTKRNLLFIFVDVQNLNFNLVANRYHFVRMVDSLGPAHFADMNKAFDAWFKFNERAIAHNIDNFAIVAAGNRVFISNAGPRTLGFLLKTKSDFFANFIHRNNINLKLLIDMNNFVRIADTAPSHVGDVQQAIDTAEVDECAEVCDILDHTLANLIGFDFWEQLFLEVFALIFKQFTPADDDIATGFINFKDFALNTAVDVVTDIRGSANINLRGWKEHIDANVYQQATLDFLGDQTDDDISFFVLGDNHFPFFLTLCFSIAKQNVACFVFNGFKKDLNIFASFGHNDFARSFIKPFIKRDYAFAFVADVNNNIIAFDTGNTPFDNFIGFKFLLVVEQPVFNISAGFRPTKGFGQLVV